MGKQSKLKASARERKKHTPPELFSERGDAVEAKILSSEASSVDSPTQEVSGGGDPLNGKPVPATSSAEEIRQLRTLNDILARRVLEARQERKQDLSFLSDLENGTVRAALAAQLSDEARRLVLVAEGRGRAVGAEEARKAADREREICAAETESRWNQAMAEAKKKNATVSEEIALLKRDLMTLASEKAIVEESLQIAQAEVGVVTGSLGDSRKALELLQGENDALVQKSQGLLQERDELQNEKSSLESKIKYVERLWKEDEEALERTRLECGALEEKIKMKDDALESSALEKASLAKSLCECQLLADDLKRRMSEAAQASAEELEKATHQRDEVKRVLDLHKQEINVLVTKSFEIAGEMRDAALSKCHPPEETIRKWGRDLDLGSSTADEKLPSESVMFAVRYMADLNADMAKIFEARSEELEQSLTETKKTVSIMEAELEDLSKVNSSLNSEVAGLRDAHDTLTGKEAGFVSEILRLKEELSVLRHENERITGEYQSQIADARRENEKLSANEAGFIHENLRLKDALSVQRYENERITGEYQSQIADARRENDELRGMLEEAGREENLSKAKIAELEQEFHRLREIMKHQESEVAELRALCDDNAREKDDMLKLLENKTQQADGLALELGHLEKGKLAVEKELRGLKESQTNQVLALGEERSSLQRSLMDAEEKVASLQELKELVLSMLRSAAAEVPSAAGDGESNQPAVNSPAAETHEEARPFAVEIEALRRGLTSLNKDVKRHQESAAAAQQEKSRWKRLSSAMAAATALVSIVFAAKVR